MWRPHILGLVVFCLCAAPAYPARHTWLGTSSNRISDAANWSGGSPVGDPQAELVFPPEAATFFVLNDVPGLRFQRLFFPYQGYTLAGQPLETTNGTVFAYYNPKITCDIAYQGSLTLGGGGGGIGIDVSGTISGSGPLHLKDGWMTFSGSRPNTYAGETILNEATVHLERRGAVAIPGDVRMVPGPSENRIYIDAPEQIADQATLDMGERGSELILNADETVRSAKLSGTLYGTETTTFATQALAVAGHVQIRTGLRLGQSVLDLPKFTLFEVAGKVSLPAGGITLRGEGSVTWKSPDSAPIRIEGATGGLTTPASSVEMSGGWVFGSVGSLKATTGLVGLYGIAAKSDVRLAPGVTFRAFPYAGASQATMELNGTLDLGGATLDVSPPTSYSGAPVVIIRNSSAQAVVGTFNGLPEGSLVLNRWRITYRGGDGNDVALTELQKPSVAAITVTSDPRPAVLGDPVTITATVSGSGPVPTGSLSFQSGDGTSLGTATLSSGKASLQITPQKVGESVYVRYSGDETYGSTDWVGASFPVTYRKPAITSIEPAEVTAGQLVPLTIRGSDFPEGARLFGGAFGEVEVVSPSEIRTTLDVTQQRAATTLAIKVGAPVGNVLSDQKLLEVRALPEPPSPIQFETAAVAATVTRRARTAWLSSSGPRQPTFLVDDDGDGIVRWQLGTVPEAVFAMVDLTSGSYAVRGHGNAYAQLMPFPAHTFVRDAAGNVSRLILKLPGDYPSPSWNILWARPGAGAWWMPVTDGVDEDQTRNNILLVSLRIVLRLGDSPAPPASFAAGDVVIAMPTASSGATPVFAARLGSEIDDDAPGVLETLTQDLRFSESDKVARLPVIRTGGASGEVSVHYRTVDRSGTAGLYFVPTSGTLTFAQGEVLKSIEIPLIDDAIFAGGGGSFDVPLFDPVGATLGENTEFVVGVYDDDRAPVVHLAEPAERHVIEGDAPVSVPIHLSLTGTTTVPVILHWQTSGAATNQSGVVKFEPGERSKTVLIAIDGNRHFDSRRTILVDFLEDSGAIVETRFVRITVDDDDRPHLRAADVQVSEKDSTARVTLTLSPAPTNGYSSINYATEDGTAKAGSDYTAKSGVILFAPGQSQQTIEIPLRDDSDTEGDESFRVVLTDYDSVFVERKSVSVVIADDEPSPARPAVSIAAATTVVEGNDATSAQIEVRLSQASTVPVRVRCTTAGGTATTGADFLETDQVITFAPGETVKSPAIPILGDPLDEPDETFTVTLSAPENATLGTAATATVTIADDDLPPTPRRRP